MTKYKEILRLKSLGFSERSIAQFCNASRNTVSKVVKRANELNVSWPLDDNCTDATLKELLFPKGKTSTNKVMPDFEYIRKELMKNGVTKSLLWAEHVEECKQRGEEPLMYSRFCYHIQQHEQRHHASMHIPRKPAEQVEVDWAGDPAYIINPDTGEITEAQIFIGVMTYSQYTYVEAFPNQKQESWIKAHIHMYEFFGGVCKLLVPDNCSTATDRTRIDFYTPKINSAYQDFAEHYNCVVVPARIRKPKDKPNAEGSVNHASTWITAALRNEQFFSLSELNQAIKEKLKKLNDEPFKKKEGSRSSLFLVEERPYLLPLPVTRFELTDWKQGGADVFLDSLFYNTSFASDMIMNCIHKDSCINCFQWSFLPFFYHRHYLIRDVAYGAV